MNNRFSPRAAHLRRLCRAAACCVVLCLGTAAAAEFSVPQQTVEHGVSPGNGFQWTSRYDAEVRDGAVWLRVSLHLVPGPGVTWADVERAAGPWRQAIRRAWSDRLALALPDGERLGIRVDVSFAGPRYHHEVVVHRGGHRTDPLHWGLTDSPWLVAHEFGHFLGAHDDYVGGAVGPEGPSGDRGSIMRAGPEDGVARPRHLAGVAAWFEGKTGLAGWVVPGEGAGSGRADVERAPGRAGDLEHKDRL